MLSYLSFLTKVTCLSAFIMIAHGSTDLLAHMPIQTNSLLHKSWKTYSQSGEEGVLEEILFRLKIEKGIFVEFGARDGINCCNTRFLAERGWRGAWIECDVNHIPNLRVNSKNFPSVACIHEFVSTGNFQPKGKELDIILNEYLPGEEIDVLSIDIDGLDYLIFENLKCKPKVICIESSGYWHPLLNRRIPDDVAILNLGQPLSIMIESAKIMGYEPVCFLTVNLFLVRRDFYHLFSDIKNDPLTLWIDSWKNMAEKCPTDLKYISDRRHDPLIKAWDPFPTPSVEDTALLELGH